MQWLESPFWRNVALLIGVTIGAGVLGIPYVFAQAGFFTGVVILVVVACLVLLCQLYLAEVVLSTKESHQLPGLAQKYLGSTGKRCMVFLMLLYIYGALLAYSLGAGDLLYSLLGLHPYLWSFVFYVLCAGLCYFSLQVLLRYEFVLVSCLVLFIFCLLGWGLPFLRGAHLTSFSLHNLFIPYGVLLFATLGFFSIPEMAVNLGKEKRLLKSTILFATPFVAFLYLLFAFLVVGVSGAATTPIATIGLGAVLGDAALLLGNIFALFAMGTSFIALVYSVKHLYMSDYGFTHTHAFLAAVTVPLLMLLWGFGNFISVISLSGALAGGIMLLCIIYMHHHVKSFRDRVPEFSIANYTWLNILLVFFILIGVALTFQQFL